MKAAFEPAIKLGIETVDKVKFAPESSIVKFPVGWFPVLVIVTACGVISA
jgi:carbon starvation protein CstA